MVRHAILTQTTTREGDPTLVIFPSLKQIEMSGSRILSTTMYYSRVCYWTHLCRTTLSEKTSPDEKLEPKLSTCPLFLRPVYPVLIVSSLPTPPRLPWVSVSPSLGVWVGSGGRRRGPGSVSLTTPTGLNPVLSTTGLSTHRGNSRNLPSSTSTPDYQESQNVWKTTRRDSRTP